MLTICLAIALGADSDVAPLPLVRATVMRESGAWLRFEGEASASPNGKAAFKLPAFIDQTTIGVEFRDKDEWRMADFSVAATPTRTAPSSSSSPSDAAVVVSASAPAGEKNAVFRCEAFTPSIHWRPIYTVDLTDRDARLTLRASIQAQHALPSEAVLECISSAAAPRSVADERWSDGTVYDLSAKTISRGTTSLVLIDSKIDVEELVAVELGAVVGEPSLKPERDRAVTVLRIPNRTAKAWPKGDLMVSRNGRLAARTAMPPVDAGASAEVPLGAAVGVSVVREEIELERKTAVIRRENDPPDSVQTAGSATIQNRTGKAINLKVTKTVAGDATGASDDAKIVRMANRLGLDQPLNEIRWSFSLPAGQSKRLTFGTMIRTPPPLEKDARQ
jgi:hypothetical protein